MYLDFAAQHGRLTCAAMMHLSRAHRHQRPLLCLHMPPDCHCARLTPHSRGYVSAGVRGELKGVGQEASA